MVTIKVQIIIITDWWPLGRKSNQLEDHILIELQVYFCYYFLPPIREIDSVLDSELKL